MAMVTVFDGVPDIFVERYDAQFRDWGRSYRARGRRCAIVFDLMPGEAMVVDEDGRPVMRGCWLDAAVDDGEAGGGGTRMVVRPATEWDAAMIERHCWDLRRVMLS
jgi:hypothetical protein